MICPKCKGERVVYHRNFESIVMLNPCPVCNGTGEVAPIVQRFKKPHTNFQRITESPEALAEFIYCLIEGCDYYAGNGARKISQYATEDTEDKFHIELIHGNRDFGELLEWLNEESKE